MPRPTRVIPLVYRAGQVAGQRLIFISLEIWDEWFDLRFTRIAAAGAAAVPRRVPPAEAWSAADDAGTTYQVVDAVGRGDRELSIGEVRFSPTLSAAATQLGIRVGVTPEEPPLTVVLDVR